jgi:DNA invertase Pin-like site-specific DNA recombinase
MRKCAIYARVSTPDQRVDNQLYDLRQIALQRSFEVVVEYTDGGISGSIAAGQIPARRFCSYDRRIVARLL